MFRKPARHRRTEVLDPNSQHCLEANKQTQHWNACTTGVCKASLFTWILQLHSQTPISCINNRTNEYAYNTKPTYIPTRTQLKATSAPPFSVALNIADTLKRIRSFAAFAVARE